MKFPSSQSALLVIDMQNGFVHPDSQMGRSPSGTRAQQAIVAPIIQAAAAARAKGVPVLWSQQEHFPEDRTRQGRRIAPHSQKQGFLPCLRGTWETALHPDLVVAPQDHIVHKHRASVFFQTNLETKLKMLGTRFLFIAGCNTEFCVESTVRDAYARDFEIVLLRDCLAGIRPEFHANSIEVMTSYFAEAVHSREFTDILE